MTDADDTTESEPTMADVDHTHPHDDRSAGELFVRGPAVAADGGRRTADSQTRDSRTMADVDHTPPNGEDVNRVFERGEEHSAGDDVVDVEE